MAKIQEARKNFMNEMAFSKFRKAEDQYRQLAPPKDVRFFVSSGQQRMS
jgi:hypothetical protein